MLLLFFSPHDTAILSWHYHSIKPGNSLTQNNHIWLQSCSPDMRFWNLSSRWKIWFTSALSLCLYALDMGSFNRSYIPICLSESTFTTTFLVSASFIRLNIEFLTSKSTTADATFCLPFPLPSLRELSPSSR